MVPCRRMRRLSRVLANVLRVVPLLFCAGVLALWARSYFVADGFRWGGTGVFVSRGVAGMQVFASPSSTRSPFPSHFAVRPAPPNPTGWHGFGYDQEGAAVIVTTYYVPLWLFAVVLAIPEAARRWGRSTTIDGASRSTHGG